MAILYGWKRPSQITSAADHTYVTSSDGCSWPCWGGAEGGQKILQGERNSRQAGYMSHNDSQAGILYGLTGVCHQTANRILYYTGLTVANTKGYAASVATYGKYGHQSKDWQNRMKTGKDISGDCNGGISCCNPLFREEVIDQLPLEDIIKSLKQELRMMINDRLGPQLDNAIIDQLLGYQEDLQTQKYQLWQQISFSSDVYTNGTNQLINQFLQQCAGLLGTENYRKLFNLDPGEQIQLVDPEIMKNIFSGPTVIVGAKPGIKKKR